ncbi:hypothetical protein RHO12_04255 [Orbus sturtevantii]|uniref:DUF6708 domain-containing protein n=1 Tax=Orbus sturtevantii TaxID=3074109 RepID=UPI00370D674B
MYIGEFLLWFGNSIKASTRKKLKMGYLNDDMMLSEVEKDYTKQSVSSNPRPIGPYYAYNERYLEIRGGMFENFRGIITMISLMLFGVLFFFFNPIIYMLSTPNYFNDGLDVFAFIYTVVLASILIYLYIRYFRYVYRLELFTIRHIRVRFNRVTQQVYIQRPKYSGGTVVFKWQHIMPANFGESGSDMGGTNMVNLLSFHPYKTGFPIAHSVGIGKNTYRAQDYKDEWEFIRRYMEYGRDNLAKPRLSTHLPLPLHGLGGHIKPMLKMVKNSKSVLVTMMMLPVFVILLPIYTAGYFISECLCWQPRWPKVIRQAGKVGKPTPKETQLSDYPPAVQQAILDSRLEWGVRDDKTGKLVDYGNS